MNNNVHLFAIVSNRVALILEEPLLEICLPIVGFYVETILKE
jgi:hypothetical protein